ncbi:phosphatidate cytidylyltransferase [Fervidobacterium islandicum]|uniref:Phosphatidate cytidylyltransferase n=1 Tax=Fervidobacterium islandicum TaxID=2423 RepID=A0AAI8CN15_FERIS|nr:phosphatidate cytidylyltransferase [Fervidobacterium islandicum]AMW33611.2 phosphatidate cytidylyltransferase [Fervidobacterium islandicum]
MQDQGTGKNSVGDNSLKRETIQRVISAFIVVPFVVFCFVSYPSLVGLVATIVLISSGEFFFTTLKKHDPWLSIIYTALVTTYPVLYGAAFPNNPMELLAVVFIVGSVFALSRVKNREIITEVYFAYSVALLYISFLLSFFIPLYAKYGAAMSLLTLTLSWSYDSFAYAFGMTMGKHKFGSYYSPNKSWEGFYGGIFGTFVYILIYQFVTNTVLKSNIHMNPLLALALAVITGVFDTFGDIFESSIKRHYGVKHMGNLMPGHGGMLDRIDGLLFITPVIYIVLNLFY